MPLNKILPGSIHLKKTEYTEHKNKRISSVFSRINILTNTVIGFINLKNKSPERKESYIFHIDKTINSGKELNKCLLEETETLKGEILNLKTDIKYESKIKGLSYFEKKHTYLDSTYNEILNMTDTKEREEKLVSLIEIQKSVKNLLEVELGSIKDKVHNITSGIFPANKEKITNAALGSKKETKLPDEKLIKDFVQVPKNHLSKLIKSKDIIIESNIKLQHDKKQLCDEKNQLNAEKEILATLIEHLNKKAESGHKLYQLNSQLVSDNEKYRQDIKQLEIKYSELTQTREEEKTKGDLRIKLLHRRSNMGDKEQNLSAQNSHDIKYKPSIPTVRSQEKYTELMNNIDTYLSIAEENNRSLNSVTQREKISLSTESLSTESLSSHSSGYLSGDENTDTVQYAANDIVDKPAHRPFVPKPNKKKGYRFNQHDQDRHEGKAPLVTIKQSAPVNVKQTKSSRLRAQLNAKKIAN